MKNGKENLFLFCGTVVSLFLHMWVVLWLFWQVKNMPEPGGSGLLMDAFLISGGDGFYQKGVPWGDINFRPGEKGASGEGTGGKGETSVSAIQKGRDALMPETFSDEKNTDMAEDITGDEDNESLTDGKESSVREDVEKELRPDRKEAGVAKEPESTLKVLTAEKREQAKKVAANKRKKSGKTGTKTAKASKKKSVVAGMSGGKRGQSGSVYGSSGQNGGQNGSGTQPYGGMIGDGAGFGAGSGSGIGIGSGKGIGDIKAARYFVRLRRLFQRRLKYPEEIENKKISGRSVVRFHIQRDGRLDEKSVYLVVSSGNEVLDRQALKTVSEAVHLPVPPYGAITVEIPIVFRVYH